MPRSTVTGGSRGSAKLTISALPEAAGRNASRGGMAATAATKLPPRMISTGLIFLPGKVTTATLARRAGRDGCFSAPRTILTGASWRSANVTVSVFFEFLAISALTWSAAGTGLSLDETGAPALGSETIGHAATAAIMTSRLRHFIGELVQDRRVPCQGRDRAVGSALVSESSGQLASAGRNP